MSSHRSKVKNRRNKLNRIFRSFKASSLSAQKKQIKMTLAYLHFISYSIAVVAASSVSLFLCFIFPSFVPYSTARTLKQTYTAKHSVFLRIQVCLAFKQKVLEQETLTFVVICSLKQTGNIVFISAELHATERIETTRIFHFTAL